MFLRTVLIQTGAFDVVDIEIEGIARRDPVCEEPAFDDVVFIQRVIGVEMPGFADADDFGRRHRVAVFVAGARSGAGNRR